MAMLCANLTANDATLATYEAWQKGEAYPGGFITRRSPNESCSTLREGLLCMLRSYRSIGAQCAYRGNDFGDKP